VTVRVLQGDCRAVLAALPAKSVHVCVTSPPYWNLRAYQTEPQVWETGNACACKGEHEWGDPLTDKKRGQAAGDTARVGNTQKRVCPPTTQQGAFCTRCGSWRGELGSEPTLDLFVAHLVEVFAAVGRVLRDDGTLWVNLGDSYCSDRAGNTTSRAERGNGSGAFRIPGEHNFVPRMQDRAKTAAAMAEANGLKVGDLCMVPARFALAMQAAGWTLRSQIVLPKRAPMPESLQSTRWERCRIRVRGNDGQVVSTVRSREVGGRVPPQPTEQDGAGDLLQTMHGADHQGLQGHAGGTSEGAGASTPDPIGRCLQDVAPAPAVAAGSHRTGASPEAHHGQAVSADRQVACDPGSGEGASADGRADGTGEVDGRAVAGDQGAHPDPLLLLREGEAVGDRPRNPGDEGRQPQPGERRASVPDVQREQGEPTAAVVLGEWTDCPGCSKCDHPDPEQRGYVQRWGSWRPTSAYEVLYLFSKAGERYYADGEAAKVRAAESVQARAYLGKRPLTPGQVAIQREGIHGKTDSLSVYDRPERNLWNYVMWSPEPSSLQHYAAFPRFIPRLAIQAGTSEAGVCPTCGAPWLRVVDRKTAVSGRAPGSSEYSQRDARFVRGGAFTDAECATLAWRQSCRCPPHSPVPATCLDPFSGSGTTLIEANALGRHGIGIELQEKYVAIAHKRLSGQPLSLFAHEGQAEFEGGAEAVG
jgi:DNA modification methylase